MAMRKKTNNVQDKLKMIYFLMIPLFLFGLSYGMFSILAEIKEISSTQQFFLNRQNQEDVNPTQISAPVEDSVAAYITKIEFIKYKNENKRKLKNLERQIRRVQNKLRMSRSPLEAN
jgi:hypothetical protein